MNIVAILNLDIKVWTRKKQLPQGNFSRSLIPEKITKQRTLKLTDIQYDIIKYEIESMEWVDYNNSVGRHVINIDDIEDFEIFQWP